MSKKNNYQCDLHMLTYRVFMKINLCQFWDKHYVLSKSENQYKWSSGFNSLDIAYKYAQSKFVEE